MRQLLAIVLTAAALASTPAALGSQATAGWTYAELELDQVEELRAAVAEMQTNPRGPYLRIRWYCNDGEVLPPRPSACREHGGGHQHAEMRPDIAPHGALGFHFGTILRATPFAQFLDEANSHYRLRELVLQQYLERVADGWVMRRARYYRGARQIEDEEAIGRDHLTRALADPEWRRRYPLLTSLLAAAVPHGQPGVAGDRIRALAQQIANLDPAFMDLRIKIHSTPGHEDLTAVRGYRSALGNDAPAQVRALVQDLLVDLEKRYASELSLESWQAQAEALGAQPLAADVASLPACLEGKPGIERIAVLATLLRQARELIDDDAGLAPALGTGTQSGRLTLALLDTIRQAESALFPEVSAWLSEMESETSTPPSRREMLRVAGVLLDAAYGTGWLTAREHLSLRAAIAELDTMAPAEVTRGRYRATVDYVTRAVEWGAGAIEQGFGPVVERYLPVEPLVGGFRDDAVRSSLLLPFARLMEGLVRDASRELGIVHMVLDREMRSGVVGLNPGVAVGTLHVISDALEVHDLDPEGIYALPETPEHLGRVAGILTLGSGSRLSHVQLLARGMGIPNAAIPRATLELLTPFEGQEVLYAVSPVGTVILRPTRDLSPAELAAFQEEIAVSGQVFTIDTDLLDLRVRSVLPLGRVGAADSGRIAGPKAANLGQLHRLFPDRVAPGLVIPFGVFRAHIDRDLDGDGRTLAEQIARVFGTERRLRAAGQDRESIREEVLRGLREVREKILAMQLLPEFREELVGMLEGQFGEPGSYGVFVRSDTNVEDLPSFSGAGLNLTVMNTIGTDAILRAIREVWASPFSARSYEWRHRIISNPEAVYPSIVVLRSVASEASGVLVTTDVEGVAAADGRVMPDDVWTVTLAKGIGGVVGGEAAETIAMPAAADSTMQPVLLASARAAWENVLRQSGGGGIDRVPVAGNVELLRPARLEDLRAVVSQILDRYPPSLDPEGAAMPWDIEFGFIGDPTWLFQIRPFVTSRVVQTLEAMQRLDRQVLANGFEPLDLDASPDPL